MPRYKCYWENDRYYNAVIEALDAYWGNEKEEMHVEIDMQFYRGDGSYQHKRFEWTNPEKADLWEGYKEIRGI